MKNTFILILLICSSFVVFGQSQRYVVFEEFTNASCGPCAAQNPAFQAIMAANTAKCTYVTYHWNFPGPNDPMFLANPDDVLARIGLYGFNFVPSCVMDGATVTGSNYAGAPANVNQTMINNEYAVPSPFELYINQQLSSGNDSIYVTMLGVCTQAVSGNFAAHNIVIEKHIHYNSPPGSNGEKDFYNVMRKMLPSSAGTPLAGSFQPGDYFIIQEAWKLENIITLGELSVIGFIQNIVNKNVLQAAVTSSTPITGLFADDVEMRAVLGLRDATCENTITPKVRIRNNGSSPLTEFNLNYKVNSGSTEVLHWTGNIGFLQTAEIQLPAIPFDLQNNNVLTFFADGTNGTGDDYVKNDTIRFSFEAAPQAGPTIKVMIKTDTHPEQITWNIKDPQGNVFASGGPYTQPSKLYTETITPGFGTCYTFTINDSGGDGILSPGFYSVTSGSTTLGGGANFGYSDSFQFYSASGTGLDDKEGVQAVNVYPNPVSGMATMTFNLEKAGHVAAALYDLHGAVVLTLPPMNFTAGKNDFVIDCSGVVPGIYNLKLSSGTQVMSRKITVGR